MKNRYQSKIPWSIVCNIKLLSLKATSLSFIIFHKGAINIKFWDKDPPFEHPHSIQYVSLLWYKLCLSIIELLGYFQDVSVCSVTIHPSSKNQNYFLLSYHNNWLCKKLSKIHYQYIISCSHSKYKFTNNSWNIYCFESH